MDKKNFLLSFPPPEKLLTGLKDKPSKALCEVNGHIHTPYSFSAFENLNEVFRIAENEKISVLGINDFYVTDGYEAFHEGCIRSGIFPLFNIEFIGLMKEEQNKGVRINDPNNPGRIYFCGKGLDYPFHLSNENSEIIEKVKEETQKQLKAMISKLNELIKKGYPSLGLSFDDIRKRFAQHLVRERHIAKALRFLALENFNTPEEQIAFIESLYGTKKSKTGLANPSALENEIRSNILKAGGSAFVEEDENSFLDIKKIIAVIKDAGGIPCYPVLLDDTSGKCTEFERDPEKLYEVLMDMGVGCIELIPGRNDHDFLEGFVDYFDKREFVITFGTEHNTPEMIPLTVSTRGGKSLSKKLKLINSKGACIIAAHQYLRAQNRQGFTGETDRPESGEIEKFEKIGGKIIEYYLSRKYI